MMPSASTRGSHWDAFPLHGQNDLNVIGSLTPAVAVGQKTTSVIAAKQSFLAIDIKCMDGVGLALVTA